MWSKTWYWTVRQGLADRAKADHAPYEDWVELGLIEALGSVTVDYTFVAEQVNQLCNDHDVVELVFDPAKMADFETACDEIGFPAWRYTGPDKPAGKGLRMVSHAQGIKVRFEGNQYCMPHSIVRLEDRILNQTIRIDNSPVTYMCASNAALDTDGQNNRAFNKKKSRGRIDGLVTIAMGAGAASAPLDGGRERDYPMIIL